MSKSYFFIAQLSNFIGNKRWIIVCIFLVCF